MSVVSTYIPTNWDLFFLLILWGIKVKCGFEITLPIYIGVDEIKDVAQISVK